jgi:hypothetical protein
VRRVDDIPFEKRFHFRDGTAAKNIKELREKIETISYDEFYQYVTEAENHFANWTEHVLEDHDLAKRIRAASHIVKTVEVLNEALHTKHRAKMKADDFQEKIEEQLFASLAKREEIFPTEQVYGAQPELPSPHELEFHGRKHGAPVTTAEPAHSPITKARPVHEESMRFIIVQFLWGFIMGLIVGFILAQVMRLIQ